MTAIFKICVREWRRIFSLPAQYMVLLVIPAVLFFLYASIYQKQKVEDLPFAIWDDDHSALSRQFSFMLEQTESIHITTALNNEQELQQLLQEGKIMGAVHFPLHMEANIKSMHPVYVSLYTNGASLVPSKLIYKDAAQVILMANAGVVIQKLVKKGMKPDAAMSIAQPIRLSTYPLYNPSYNYQDYLVPGLITVALQMIIIMAAVLLLNYERTTNTMAELYEVSKGSASSVIIGKTLAHLGIAWINFVLVACVIFPAFKIGSASANVNFFVIFTLLALACLGVGQMISALSKDIMLASDVALFYTSPAFVFSGYTFPRWAMPWYDQFYAQIMPYTAFLDAYIKVFSMKLPLRYANPEMGKLFLFIAITFPVAIIVFQRQLNKEGGNNG